jgi:glycogen synthase
MGQHARRVLFWSERFWPYVGGVEVLAMELLRALPAKGYEFAVITSHSDLELPDESQYDGIRVRRFPFEAALVQRDVAQLIAAKRTVAAFARSFAPDLIHYFSVGPSAFFHLQTRNAYPGPTLLTLHGEVLRGGANGGDTVLEKELGCADFVSCVSQASLHAARRMMPSIAERSSVNHIGLPAPPVEPARLPIDPPRLLCLGRLVRDKGFDLALTALATLRGAAPEVCLMIAGDGPERASLEEQAAALGIRDRVEFLGWVSPDKVPDLINSATMLIMPSRREAMPLVAIQAGQMARPVVATRVGGLPEVIIHGETGLLVQPDDAAAVATTVASLLEKPDVATTVGRAAYRRVRESFSWESHVNRLDQLYRALITRSDG